MEKICMCSNLIKLNKVLLRLDLIIDLVGCLSIVMRPLFYDLEMFSELFHSGETKLVTIVLD